MDSFDRHTRQREIEVIASEKNRGYGPASRARRGISLALGLFMVVAFVIYAVVNNGSVF